MIERKEFQHPLKSKRTTYFQDLAIGRQYRRIIGVVSWPSERFAGIIGVFGESLRINKALDQHYIYLIAEAYKEEAGKLLAKCYDYNDLYLVEKWYGDDENLPMIELLTEANEGVSDDESLHIASIPLFDDKLALEYYISLVKKRTRPGKKSIFFGEGSRLAAQLAQVAPEDIKTAKPQNIPSLLVVGGALAVFERKPPDYRRMQAEDEEYLNMISTDEMI